MKNLIQSSAIMLIYLLIIIFFHEVLSAEQTNEAKAVHGEQVNATKDPPSKESVNATKVPPSKEAVNEAKEQAAQNSKSKRQSNSSSGGNSTNPLADLFQISDPGTRQILGSIYGAYNGNDQCSRKAFCMLGNYLKDMPARDLVFYLMRQYVPPDYTLYFQIFQAAVMYGQDCNVYVCDPDQQSDAASAAARPSFSFFNQGTSTSTTPSPQQNSNQQSTGRPQTPSSWFGNAGPR